MKKLIPLLMFLFLIAGCSSDEDNKPAYPATFHFSKIASKELLLWVNGESVNTANYSVEELVPGNIDFFSYNGTKLTFLDENNFEFATPNAVQTLPYTNRHDSIFYRIGNDGELFLGIRNAKEFLIMQGLSYVSYEENESRGNAKYYGEIIFDFENSQNKWNSTADMGQRDTLVVYNETYLFK